MINNRKSPIQDEYIEDYLANKDLDLEKVGYMCLCNYDDQLDDIKRHRTRLLRVLKRLREDGNSNSDEFIQDVD